MAEFATTGIGTRCYPGQYTCVDISAVTLPENCCPMALFAPMLPDGVATADCPVDIISESQAIEQLGQSSVAQLMASHILRTCPDVPLRVIPQADSGVKAEWRITIDFDDPAANRSSATGSVVIQVEGTMVVVPLPSDSSRSELGMEFVDAINAQNLPVEASLRPGGTVSIVSLNGGEVVNCMALRIADDFDLPDGMTINIDQNVVASGFYDIGPGLDKISDCCIDFFVSPYNDAATLQLLDDETLRVRWGCGCTEGGRFYFHDTGTFGELKAKYGEANYRYGSLVACCEEDLTGWLAIAGVTAAAYCSTCQNPAKGWVDLPIGISCANDGCSNTCWTKEEREALSCCGIGTLKCGPEGYAIADDTGLAKDANGDTDPRWRYPQLAYQTMRVVRWLENLQSERYQNTIVVRDANESIGRGAVTDTATPAAIANEIFAEFKNEFDAFIVDVSDQDLRDVICTFVDERDPSCFGTVLNTNFTASLRRFKNKINPTVGVNRV